MSLDLSALNRVNTQSFQDFSLDKLYLFEGIDAEVRESILAESFRESFDPNMVLILERAPSNGKAYIILSGRVEVSKGGEVIGELSDGAIFGEYALICAEDRTASVRTLEKTECLVLDEDTLIRISNENNKINEIMMERIVAQE